MNPALRWNSPHQEWSERVASVVAEVAARVDATHSASDLARVDALLDAAIPESHDAAALSRAKGTVLAWKGEFAESIPLLEAALASSDRHGFFDRASTQQIALFLARLHSQESTVAPDVDVQREHLRRSRALLERTAPEHPSAGSDEQLLLASVLYAQLLQTPSPADRAIAQRLQLEAEKGLLMRVRPNEGFYVALVVSLQRQNEPALAAEYLELLVKNNPGNEAAWRQLAVTYSTLHQDLRAALTIERAQSYGYLTASEDWGSLAILYYALKQPSMALELLEKSIPVPPEPQNGDISAPFHLDESLGQVFGATTLQPVKGITNQPWRDRASGEYSHPLDMLDGCVLYLFPDHSAYRIEYRCTTPSQVTGKGSWRLSTEGVSVDWKPLVKESTFATKQRIAQYGRNRTLLMYQAEGDETGNRLYLVSSDKNQGPYRRFLIQSALDGDWQRQKSALETRIAGRQTNRE
ncbi:MAG: hypothetical protein U1F61_10265 [Opitutaceae bacterium]